MALDLSLLDIETMLKKLGKFVVFYAVDGSGDPEAWDGTSELELEHLGVTEGDISWNPNGSVATLTLPEHSGGAIYEATDTGENPVLEMPLFLADPDLLPIVSPRGTASGGYSRVCDVSERTLVLFPEELFKVGDDCLLGSLTHDADGWKVNGVALTSAQETLMACSLWVWRCYFDRPSLSFRGGHGDDGKNVETVAAHAMMHPTMPNGHRLYTRGDPDAVSGIDIEGASS